jgi:hypothetical protein
LLRITRTILVDITWRAVFYPGEGHYTCSCGASDEAPVLLFTRTKPQEAANAMIQNDMESGGEKEARLGFSVERLIQML